MAERRDALKIIGAVGATCAFPYAADELYGQHSHPPAQPQAPGGNPRFFKPLEFALISRLADLIIPATETPGALAAGVPGYIDGVVLRNPQHQSLIREGLRRLDQHARDEEGAAFLRLKESRQIALLRPICEASERDDAKSPLVEFFRVVKSMTADGYYTSKIGLVDELGFKGGSVLAEFPSCELPEC